MDTVITFVASAYGVAVLFTVVCGIVVVCLAIMEPPLRKDLFNTCLELFKLGVTRFLGSIRGQDHKDQEKPPSNKPNAFRPEVDNSLMPPLLPKLVGEDHALSVREAGDGRTNKTKQQAPELAGSD